MSAKNLDPIVYGKQIVNGLVVRPDSRSVVRKALEGHPIVVDSNNDYINLYHVFERLAKAEKIDDVHLVRKQIGESRWILCAISQKSDAPSVQLQQGYDPKRGRYKRYAEQLAAGSALTFSDKTEAIKARRAWQLYIPSERRRNLRSSVRLMGKSGRYLVCLLPKAKR
jgi:hypothetical protein